MDSYMQGSYDANHGQGFRPALVSSIIQYTIAYLKNRRPSNPFEKTADWPSARQSSEPSRLETK